jgi:hypothetical protein
MNRPNFNNIHVEEADDGWLHIYDRDKKLATAWDLRSSSVFINNHKKNTIRRLKELNK